MFRYLTLALVLSTAVRAQVPKAQVYVPPDDRFAAFEALDPSSCDVLGKLMADRDVQLRMIEARNRHGLHLRKIAFLATDSEITTRAVFRFVTFGNPFGPPTDPKFGEFSVRLSLPQDAGWQVGETTELSVYATPRLRPLGASGE